MVGAGRARTQAPWLTPGCIGTGKGKESEETEGGREGEKERGSEGEKERGREGERESANMLARGWIREHHADEILACMKHARLWLEQGERAHRHHG